MKGIGTCKKLAMTGYMGNWDKEIGAVEKGVFFIFYSLLFLWFSELGFTTKEH